VLIDSTAVLVAAIIVPFVLCFWWPKANRTGVLLGMFGGLSAWFVAAMLGSAFPPDLIGLIVSLIVTVLAVLVTQKIDPPRPLTDYDGNPVELKDRFGSLGLRD